MASVELDIECGDIVLFSRNCYRMPPLPAAICVSAKVSSWTVWDHVGIVVEHPDSHELLLLEANMQGITIYPLIDRLRRTSSTAVAVRKLHRMEETGKSIDFPRALWDTAQQYLKYQYNSSFAHMTAAAYASYTSHLSTYARLHDQLFTLKQELDYIYDYLNHEEDLAKAIANQQATSFRDSPEQQAAAEKQHSILGRSLLQRAAKLVNEIENIEQTFQKLVTLRQTIQQKSLPGMATTAGASSTLSPSSTNTQKGSETSGQQRFYCSQLVAQVFMDMGVLSRVHRQPHEYVPADFSSSTKIQGLLPLNHGPDHDYHQQHMQLTDDDAKKPRYYFSPDYIIPSPNSANFTVRLPTADTVSNAQDANSVSGTKVSILVQPATIVTTAKSAAKNDISTTATATATSVATLQLHTGDTIRSSILSQYLHPSASVASLVNIDIDGEVLLRPLPTNTQRPPSSSAPMTPTPPVEPMAVVENTAITAVPPSVILTGTTTQNPSSSLSLFSSSTVAAARLKLKKTLDSIPTSTSTTALDRTDATMVSTVAPAATPHAHNDYDDDSVAMTLRAFDHHYRSDVSRGNDQDRATTTDDYELLALKASKVTFHYATTTPLAPSSQESNDAVVAKTAQEQEQQRRHQRHQRLHEEKLLRWRYVESLVSLAWPTYLASQQQQQQQPSSTGGGASGGGVSSSPLSAAGARLLPSFSIGSDAFDNDLEKWQALWQDLIAYLPPLPPVSSSSAGSLWMAGDIKSVTELRMFFAFVCFWDDTIRNLLVLLPSLLRSSSSSSSSSSPSSSSVFLQEMHRKAQDQRAARVMHHTAEDLADLLLHLYDVHRSSSTATGTAASPSWVEQDATHLQYEHRRQVLIARIEQLLPQYLPTSSMMATSPVASNDVLPWSSLVLMPILAATTAMAATFSSPRWTRDTASSSSSSYSSRSSAWNPPSTMWTTASPRPSPPQNLWSSARVVVAAVVRRASRW